MEDIKVEIGKIFYLTAELSESGLSAKKDDFSFYIKNDSVISMPKNMLNYTNLEINEVYTLKCEVLEDDLEFTISGERDNGLETVGIEFLPKNIKFFGDTLLLRFKSCVLVIEPEHKGVVKIIKNDLKTWDKDKRYPIFFEAGEKLDIPPFKHA